MPYSKAVEGVVKAIVSKAQYVFKEGDAEAVGLAVAAGLCAYAINDKTNATLPNASWGQPVGVVLTKRGEKRIPRQH